MFLFEELVCSLTIIVAVHDIMGGHYLSHTLYVDIVKELINDFFFFFLCRSTRRNRENVHPIKKKKKKKKIHVV
jgi:membrane-associated PAP2 superfamily phosphatase